MNPLDAICDRKRPDAVCVSNLKNAKPVDKSVLVDRPDVKIFLPFRFYVYEPKTLFIPNTYNKFLGKLRPGFKMLSVLNRTSAASFCKTVRLSTLSKLFQQAKAGGTCQFQKHCARF